MNQQEKRYRAALNSTGVFLDPRVERKCVDGVWGMYANSSIKQGEVFASFDKRRSLKGFSDIAYDGAEPEGVRWVLLAARQLQGGPESEEFGHVSMFEDLTDLESVCVYFCPDNELKQLYQMNPILHLTVCRFKALVDGVTESVMQLDKGLDRDVVLKAVLNWQSRAWDSYGFLPVMDLFNHCHARGGDLLELSDRTLLGHIAQVDYAAGDQVFISYAPKDMYRHAICYHYFDLGGQHLIDYALRVHRNVDSPQAEQVAQAIARQYPVQVVSVGQKKQMQIVERNLFFTEEGPNQNLLEFFAKTSFSTLNELQTGRCSKQSIAENMLQVLQALRSANQVNSVNEKELPARIQRFHPLLKKELAMLDANEAWVRRSFGL